MPNPNQSKRGGKRKKVSPDSNTDTLPTKPFVWSKLRSDVALYLAQGFTWDETSAQHEISRDTIAVWKRHPDFAAEVDRLSLMMDVAGRAYRLRLAMRIIRDKGFKSDRDLLDWLRYAQSETDGVKLDLTKLAAALGDDAPLVADRGQARVGALATPTDSDNE